MTSKTEDDSTQFEYVHSQLCVLLLLIGGLSKIYKKPKQRAHIRLANCSLMEAAFCLANLEPETVIQKQRKEAAEFEVIEKRQEALDILEKLDS